MRKHNSQPNYGFVLDTIFPEDYVLGGERSAPQAVVVDDGQWDEFLPGDEIQNRFNLETSNCATFGTINAVEILELAKYGTSPNYSDRYIGTMAGNTPQGNSPHKVAETIRNIAGLIEENEWPWTHQSTWNEYYSPIPRKIQDKGRRWLDKNTFKHEWVFYFGETMEKKQIALKDALQFSPIGASVRAWDQEGELYTKRPGEQDNHWIVIYGYEWGEYWKVFDTYDSTRKKLIWNYDFQLAKRYHLERSLRKRNWLRDLGVKLVGII